MFTQFCRMLFAAGVLSLVALAGARAAELPAGAVERQAVQKQKWSTGKSTPIEFDVGWLSQIFNRGHRIRMTIASTGALFYEPNPNPGEPLTIDPPPQTIVARNGVYHEAEHASRILALLRAASGGTDKSRLFIRRRPQWPR